MDKEKFAIGERLYCKKSFRSISHNNGKLTEISEGMIYTVREFNRSGHVLLKEVAFVNSDGSEAGFYPSKNSEYFFSIEDILKEDES